ncbi:YhgE/Pip domain-containing protein [Kutzneria albida]|uniref:YhgE/Pip C-terminal domain protein n=1 Tax=Kutzneria albida DSM 43870 TaxID=1449976 RepID=W5W506_9PSEU|nr:YhgE/Pip domain-containing protein [Kutzneria albida]AHH95982.1 YhgE/Pip C-terminal domain protein [Kutzneria albida DSM 43870]
MSPLRLAANELRRITAGRLPKIAVLALVLVPLLYGAMYLYANWDPYGNLTSLPVALVVDDKGAEVNGKQLNAGNEVADELLREPKFDWHRVSDAEAEAGVRDNKYTFALTLPEDFSQALASSADFKPRQGVLKLTTNDSNNYVARTIADKVVETVRAAVATKVGSKAADQLLLGFSTIREQTAKAADGATQLADGIAKANDGATQLASGSSELSTGQHKLLDGATQLASGLDQLKSGTAELPAKSQQLADGAQQVADGNAKVAAGGQVLAGASQQFVNGLNDQRSAISAKLHALGLTDDQVNQALSVLDQARKPIDDANGKVQGVSGQLNQLADGSRRVAAGAAQLAGSAPQLADGIAKADAGAVQLRDGEKTAVDGGDKLASGAAQLSTGTKKLVDGSVQLRDGLNAGINKIPDPNDPTRTATANTIGDPVAVQTLGQSTAGTYGAGLAPFFLGLATWIGAFVLFLLLRPLSRRALAANQHPLVVALGGWLPAALLSAAQVVLLFAVVTTLVGVHPANPLGTLGFLVLTGLAFTAMLHGLNALLGAVGKFLGLVLLVLQLTTAGGTFPWQTIPAPLQPLHLALPLGYVVDGMRHLLYGGSLDGMGADIAVIGGYLLVGLALSTLAAYKQRVWTVSRLKPELVL